MAVTARTLPTGAAASPGRRPALRLAPAPAPQSVPASRRDAAYALCLALVLGIGVVGVLLLNTSMQQQSDHLDAQRQRIATLSTRVQELRTVLDQASDPGRLATKARELHLRPMRRIHYLDAGDLGRGRRLSAR